MANDRYLDLLPTLENISASLKTLYDDMSINEYTNQQYADAVSAIIRAKLAESGIADISTDANIVFGFYYNGKFYSDSAHEHEMVPNSQMLYFDMTGLDIYYYTTEYLLITSTLKLGETSSTAYRGDRGKTAYDHSQIIGNPHGTTIGTIDGLQGNLNTLQSNIDTVAGNLSTEATARSNADTTLQDNIDLKEDKANKNVALGYCPLDSSGKVPIGNLPSNVLHYVGQWNASTNTPTLVSPDVSKAGYVYQVSVAGTRFGFSWDVKDWLIYDENGIPEKSDSTDNVVSVNGKTGIIVLNAADIGLGNVPNVTTNNQTPTYTVTSVLASLVSGEILSAAFGKIAKAVNDLISHIANTSNPHSVTKTQVGLGNVDNTADSAKNVLSASKLTTARTIGGVAFDGTANINLPGVNAAGSQDTTGNAASATTAGTLTGLTASIAELNFSDGVTSNIQTQLNNKLGLHAQADDSALVQGLQIFKNINSGGANFGTGRNTTLYTSAGYSFVCSNCYYDGTNWMRYAEGQLAAVLIINTNGDINIRTAPAGTGAITWTIFDVYSSNNVSATATELGYVHGVTSNIQTQLNGKAPTSHASTGTTYGAGTTANYGHNLLVDALTESALTAGHALSAHQGYVLNQATVHKTGDESIAGIKSFTEGLVLPGFTSDPVSPVARQIWIRTDL